MAPVTGSVPLISGMGFPFVASGIDNLTLCLFVNLIFSLPKAAVEIFKNNYGLTL